MEHKLRSPGGSPQGAAPTKNSQTKLWLMLAVIVGVLLVVLLVLPTMVSNPEPDQQIDAVIKVETPVSEEPVELVVVEKLRSQAQQALQSFIRLQAQPDLNNAEVWAADNWQAAMQAAANGDQQFGREKYSAALKIYTDAIAKLQAILDGREQILSQRLASGWQFLQADKIVNASTDFELVLAMEPDHQEAQLGLERASVRTPVLQFMLKGQQAEVTTDLPLAAEAYSAALGLDMLYAPAQEALSSVTLELERMAFQDAVGRALQGLHNGKFTQAEKALLEAEKIYPADESLKDIRQRLLSARRKANLGNLRVAAGRLVKQENWVDAREKYKRALAIDPQAAFAQNGLLKSQEKLQLHKQLDHYLADTSRLYSSEPLANASKLLAANQQVPTSEPKLALKLAKLQQAVAVALVPIDVLIVSDNLTEVLVYKVGRQGSFMQKNLSLLPGKYTITGSRQGYQDVLKVFELQPGVDRQTIHILSGEKF